MGVQMAFPDEVVACVTGEGSFHDEHAGVIDLFTIWFCQLRF